MTILLIAVATTAAAFVASGVRLLIEHRRTSHRRETNV